MVIYNSVHIIKLHSTLPCKVVSTSRENAKLKCSEISTPQNRQIKMQLKYSVLQYLLCHKYFRTIPGAALRSNYCWSRTD